LVTGGAHFSEACRQESGSSRHVAGCRGLPAPDRDDGHSRPGRAGHPVTTKNRAAGGAGGLGGQGAAGAGAKGRSEIGTGDGILVGGTHIAATSDTRVIGNTADVGQDVSGPLDTL
jgi:hypothetical protein